STFGGHQSQAERQEPRRRRSRQGLRRHPLAQLLRTEDVLQLAQEANSRALRRLTAGPAPHGSFAATTFDGAPRDVDDPHEARGLTNGSPRLFVRARRPWVHAKTAVPSPAVS